MLLQQDLFIMTVTSVFRTLEEEGCWIIDQQVKDKFNAKAYYIEALRHDIPWRKWSAWLHEKITAYLREHNKIKFNKIPFNNNGFNNTSFSQISQSNISYIPASSPQPFMAGQRAQPMINPMQPAQPMVNPQPMPFIPPNTNANANPNTANPQENCSMM